MSPGTLCIVVDSDVLLPAGISGRTGRTIGPVAVCKNCGKKIHAIDLGHQRPLRICRSFLKPLTPTEELTVSSRP